MLCYSVARGDPGTLQKTGNPGPAHRLTGSTVSPTILDQLGMGLYFSSHGARISLCSPGWIQTCCCVLTPCKSGGLHVFLTVVGQGPRVSVSARLVLLKIQKGTRVPSLFLSTGPEPPSSSPGPEPPLFNTGGTGSPQWVESAPIPVMKHLRRSAEKEENLILTPGLQGFRPPISGSIALGLG